PFACARTRRDLSWLDLPQEAVSVALPMNLDFLDRSGEGLVGVADEGCRLVLRAIGVNVVTVTETVGIVKANDRPPLSLMRDLQLHGVLDNALAASHVSATQAGQCGRQLLQPFALD